MQKSKSKIKCILKFKKEVKCELAELRKVVRKLTRNKGKIGVYTNVNGQYIQ